MLRRLTKREIEFKMGKDNWMKIIRFVNRTCSLFPIKFLYFAQQLHISWCSRNHVPEILQPQHFIKISINADGGHLSNYIRRNEVNLANEPLKVEQPLLESSSEIDKLPCITNTEHSLDTKITAMGTSFRSCYRILIDGEFQLTEPWSAKYLVTKPKNEKLSLEGR